MVQGKLKVIEEVLMGAHFWFLEASLVQIISLELRVSCRLVQS